MKRWLWLCLFLGGCVTQWREIQNATGDRLWLISYDQSIVLRCIDATPNQKPLGPRIDVVCQSAYMRGAVAPGGE